MSVSLEDLYKGATRKLALQKNVICDKCKGNDFVIRYPVNLYIEFGSIPKGCAGGHPVSSSENAEHFIQRYLKAPAVFNGFRKINFVVVTQ